MSRLFCRFHVADSQFVEWVVEVVVPGFLCLGWSLGCDGGNVSGCLSCNVMCVANKVFAFSCLWIGQYVL